MAVAPARHQLCRGACERLMRALDGHERAGGVGHAQPRVKVGSTAAAPVQGEAGGARGGTWKYGARTDYNTGRKRGLDVEGPRWSRLF